MKRGCFLDNSLHISTEAAAGSDRNVLLHAEMDTLLCLDMRRKK